MEDRASTDAELRLDAALRAKTPAERLAIVDAMWRSARDMIRHRIRVLHPEWDESQVARETARRMAGGAL